MNKTILYIGMFLILAVGSIVVFGNRQIGSAGEISRSSRQSGQTVGEQTESEQTASEETAPEQARAEQVMKALAQAYPQQIDRAEFLNDDWAVLLRGKWYFYANGRILPENLLSNVSDYSASPFYNYQAELPAWRTPSAEESERYSAMSRNRTRNPPRRSSHFFDDLWRASNRSDAYDRIKTIRFLGHSVTVHYMILENISLVEERILAIAKTDPQVQTWINSISRLEGWSWRNIAETQSRSYHSYGLAIDIMPRSYGGKETYWLWTSNYRADWWNVSYNDRYHPPDAVIKAFETYGFIWGGKWLYYDTMHFEYRPELLILGGIPPETRR
jgi:hypothetical protein